MKTRGALVIVAALAMFLIGAATVLDKSQLPTVTAYTDAAQTFTSRQTISGGLSLTGGAPASNGDIGWNSTTSRLEFRHNNATSEFGGGGGSFDGNVDGTTQGYLSGNQAANPIKLRDTHGTSFQDGSGKEGAIRRILAVSTTTSAQTEMLINGTDRLTLAQNTAKAYHIRILARGATGTNTGKVAHYHFDATAARGAGDVVLVGSILSTTIAEDVAAWDCTVTVNVTNQATQVMVTPDANGNIDWRGFVDEIALP